MYVRPALYDGAMTVSAHDVAAELRRRLPGLPVKKLHKLLYYCQGHHLATLDRPLFGEQIAAWDMGPVVPVLWRNERDEQSAPPQRELGEAELNTIGYVISRYGKLTGTDLEHLTHGEAPWQRAAAARAPRDSAPIRQEWIKEYFRTNGAAGHDDEEPGIDTAEVRQWLAYAAARPRPSRPDSLDSLKARATAGV